MDRAAPVELAPSRTPGSAVAAMLLAAGRGERMRPLSDTTPKPLLPVAGKPLIVHQIEALRRAGITEVVINAAHLADRLMETLRDGEGLDVRIRWSVEPEPLETAGGIATASPLLAQDTLLVASGDVWTDFDYATLLPRARAMAADPAAPRVHLVMVPNPDYHPRGDFVLAAGRLAREGGARLTFGNIALYDKRLFTELPRGTPLKLLPFFEAWIDAGLVSGERYDGLWANVGTPADLAALDALLRRRASRS